MLIDITSSQQWSYSAWILFDLRQQVVDTHFTRFATKKQTADLCLIGFLIIMVYPQRQHTVIKCHFH